MLSVMAVPQWNPTGYDMAVGERWLYMFATSDRSLVKVGLVLQHCRLAGLLLEVRKASNHSDLEQTAAAPLPDVNHPEAEHIEATARHWLCGTAEFRHAGLVDWLQALLVKPDDWQALLDSAATAALRFDR